MTSYDQDNDDFDGDDFGQTQQLEDNNLKRLRENAKKAPKLEKENAELREELLGLKRTSAFEKAGIDLATPMGRLFADAYKDEPDPDKVKARALEYGVIQPSAQMVEQAEKEQSLQRLSQMTGHATSGAPAQTLDADTYASWGSDVRRAFLRDHPREAQALKRGETIPAVPGYA